MMENGQEYHSSISVTSTLITRILPSKWESGRTKGRREWLFHVRGIKDSRQPCLGASVIFHLLAEVVDCSSPKPRPVTPLDSMET